MKSYTIKKSLTFFKFVKQVFREFSRDNVLKFSASLAYYTILSLAPLLVIIISVSGFLFGKEAMSGRLYAELKEMIGANAALQIQEAIKNIHLSHDNFLAATIGVIVLLVSATGIFGEMQDSLNRIWGLRIKQKGVWWKVFLDRLISFSLILSLGFTFVVSLALNAIVASLTVYISKMFSQVGVVLIFVLDTCISVFITMLLFATIFRVLPDAKIKWKDVLMGAFITAILFLLGKYGIGYYLGRSKVSDIYGAAGSIMIIMLWVYYSSAILYIGAIITKVYASSYGRLIYPNKFSTWVKIEEISSEKNTLVD